MIPINAKIAINGILVNLLRNKNRPQMQIMVIIRVKILKSVKVRTMIVRGLVSALELAEMKNALMLSMAKGKNYDKYTCTLTKAMRVIPNTILA